MSHEPAHNFVVRVSEPHEDRQSDDQDSRRPGENARIGFQNVRCRKVDTKSSCKQQEIRHHDAHQSRGPGTQPDQQNSKQSAQDEPGELPAAAQVGSAAANAAESEEHQQQGGCISAHQERCVHGCDFQHLHYRVSVIENSDSDFSSNSNNASKICDFRMA